MIPGASVLSTGRYWETMRRVASTLALALFLLGCSTPVALLTGVDSCYAGAQHPAFQGVLVPDPEYGTKIDGKGPVMWPVGYTARGAGLFWGEIEVLDEAGMVVATTGKAYSIAPAPMPRGEAGRLMERVGAIPAPNCYSHDFVDCSSPTSDPDAERYCPRR